MGRQTLNPLAYRRLRCGGRGGPGFSRYGAWFAGAVYPCVGCGDFRHYGRLVDFLVLPTAFLHGRAAAGGIALINCIGNLGGYFGPVILGWVKQHTGDVDVGLYVLACALCLAALLVLVSGKDGLKNPHELKIPENPA